MVVVVGGGGAGVAFSLWTDISRHPSLRRLSWEFKENEDRTRIMQRGISWMYNDSFGLIRRRDGKVKNYEILRVEHRLSLVFIWAVTL